MAHRVGSVLGGVGVAPEHVELQEVAARWLAAHCSPEAARSAAPDALPALWDDLMALDWARLDPPELVVILEECGRALLPGPFVPTLLARHVVGPEVRGDTPLAVALGSPLPVSSDRGDLRLHGVVRPVLGATLADAVVVPVVTPDGADAWCRVDPGRDGVTVRALPSLDQTRAVGEVVLDAAPVHAHDVIRTGPARGDVVALAAVLLAAEATGMAQWCLETAAEHARTRIQFGRPIGAFQAVKHRCADMLVGVEVARAVTWDAAQALTGDASGQAFAVAAAAAIAPEVAVECAKSAIQVLGGIGFTWEHDAHRYLRRAVSIRAVLEVAPWRRDLARLALSGVRRSRNTVLPAEADDHRADVRGFLAGLGGLDESQVRRAVADSGYLVPEWPRPWGRSASPAEQVVVDEEFRAARVPRPDLHVGMWALPTLIAHGTAAQQERWIRPTLVGDVTWCQLFSEPTAGSDLASLATKASRVEGGWLLTGQKVWTSLADTADVGLALARTSATDPPHAGITCFVVDMRSAGVEVRPLRELTGHPSFNEVFLTDVFVPDEDVVGDVDDGWAVGRTTLANERVTMGRGSSLGRGVEGLVRLVGESPELASDGGVLDAVGGLVAEAHALGVLGHRVALRALAGGQPGPEGSVRKLLSAEHDQRVEELGLRLLGPEGATQDGAARGWSIGFLMTRCLTIAGGTSEIQRNVLAERLLRLPRDC